MTEQEKHWSDGDLLDLLYGVRSADAHWESCADCQGRSARMSERRKELAAEPAMSFEELAAQRRKIYQRMESAERRWWHPRVVSAATAMAMLVVGLAYYDTHRAPKPVADPDDAVLFADIAKLDQNVEPRATAPVRALFEDKQ